VLIGCDYRACNTYVRGSGEVEMSREIKFRAWDKERKQIFPVSLMDFSQWWVDCGLNGERNSFRNEETDRHILMQYTGLKDRNGKEIYEGDILSNGSHIDWIVKYRDAAFQVEHVGQITNDSWHLERGMAESREVIGNIYENPELLGGSDT
jgi:uncharacterized phage protein (TIGR01671 family)